MKPATSSPRAPLQPDVNVRAIAAKIITRVVDTGLTLDAAMAEHLPVVQRRDDGGFVKALCFGTLRWYDQLEFLLDRYLDKPLKARDSDIRTLVMVGLYQLHHLKTPHHAAVSETVDATTQLDKAWAKPLVNAVLRRSQREYQRHKPELERHPGTRYSHPAWLVDMTKADWPDHWEAILHANNQRPPQYLRVNVLRGSRDDYLENLEQAGIPARQIDLTPAGVEVMDPVDVYDLPGFDRGKVSVQDTGAQLAADLLDLQPGHLVLDACAAPGGKAAHICETQPHIAGITALDVDEKRIARLHGTLSRLNLPASVIKADATQPQTWWDRRAFDRILVDAPCSATGVIRRHPDIKRRRAPAQLPVLHIGQTGLLAALWPLLKPGGRLLYSTCSLLHTENDRVIELFLNQHPAANLETIRADWGIATNCGRQLLPNLDATDGFYYAILTKAG